MFQGTLTTEMRSIIAEHAAAWPAGCDVYVGCSGNLTVERVLDGLGDPPHPLHGNDVNPYSVALGLYFSGQRVDFELKPESAELMPWLPEYLDGREGTLAALMLGTRFLTWVGKPGAYYERMVKATADQWPRMHEKTVAKLLGARLRLASFYAGDVREFLAQAPTDNPVVLFPPFFAGDYEQMFKGIDEHFDWPRPDYPELDDDGKEEMIQLVADRPYWFLAVHVERPELRRHLRALVQTTNRGVPINVYSGVGARRIVKPRQETAPLLIPKLGPEELLGEQMRLHVLSGPQFSAILSQFMSKSIKPGSPLLACGVSVDRRLIGAFAYLPPKFGDAAYLMSDFPVSWSRYRRLAKLVVMAGMSSEAQLLLQRSLNRGITSMATTAFSDRPNSSKYGRGIPGMKLASRKEPAEDGVHRFQLQYNGPLGDWTLQEALQIWTKKHGGDQR